MERPTQRILLVEDHADTRELFALTLKAHGYNAIRSSHNPASATLRASGFSHAMPLSRPLPALMRLLFQIKNSKMPLHGSATAGNDISVSTMSVSRHKLYTWKSYEQGSGN